MGRGRAARAAALAAMAGAAAAQAELGDLDPANMRCCYLIERPYTDLKSDGELTGLSSDYLTLLGTNSSSMRESLGVQFKCSKLELFDVDGYDGFTGVTKYFQSCAENGSSAKCRYDIAVSGFATTAERLERVDIVAPFAFDSLAAVQRTKDIGQDGGALFFLAPFASAVWAGIASLVVLHIFVTLFDRNFMPPEASDAPPPGLLGLKKLRHTLLRTKLLRRVRYAFFQTAFSMVAHEPGRNPRPQRLRSVSTRQRTLQLMALLTGLFLTLTYESALVLQVFRDDPISRFRSIDDVKFCGIGATDVCLPAGGAEEDFWKNAITEARARCRIDEEEEPEYVSGRFFDSPFSAGLAAVNEGRCKFFMAAESTVTVASKRSFCGTLSAVGETFYPMSIGYVLPKNSPLTEHLSIATLQFQQEGLLKNPIEYGKESFQANCSDEIALSVGWERLGTFFYFVFAGQAAVFIYMLFDRRELSPSEETRE